MKKAEKNGEDETDTMICDEGEPSRPLSSDYENQETVEGISDVSSGSLIEILRTKSWLKPFNMKHAENLISVLCLF